MKKLPKLLSKQDRAKLKEFLATKSPNCQEYHTRQARYRRNAAYYRKVLRTKPGTYFNLEEKTTPNPLTAKERYALGYILGRLIYSTNLFHIFSRSFDSANADKARAFIKGKYVNWKLYRTHKRKLKDLTFQREY